MPGLHSWHGNWSRTLHNTKGKNKRVLTDKRWEAEQVVLTQVHSSLHWVIWAFRVLCTPYFFTHPTHLAYTLFTYPVILVSRVSSYELYLHYYRPNETWRVSLSHADKTAGNRCLWLTNPFDRGHKVDNIPLFALPLVTNCSNLMKKRSMSCQMQRPCHLWQKSFDKLLQFHSNISGGDYGDIAVVIVLKINAEHDLHQKMRSVDSSEVTYPSVKFAGLPCAIYRLRSMTPHSTHTTHWQKPVKSDQTLRIFRNWNNNSYTKVGLARESTVTNHSHSCSADSSCATHLCKSFLVWPGLAWLKYSGRTLWEHQTSGPPIHEKWLLQCPAAAHT